MVKTLLVNRFITPDGTVLYSHSAHDFVSHTDANGELYYTDGGNSYIHTTVNDEPMQDCCLYTTDSIEDIREVLEISVLRDNAVKYVALKDLTTSELLNQLEKYDPEVNCSDSGNVMFITLAREIVYRHLEGKMKINTHD